MIRRLKRVLFRDPSVTPYLSYPALLLCLSFFSPGLMAGSLETITVTASRTPLTIGETGSAVTIISREDIERSQAGTLQELLRHVPGLAVGQQGALGAVTQVRMRGAEANQLLVMIDGVEANDVAQSSEFNFAHLLAANIERVEVVRGPQSSLWGGDALAGVIHVITRPDSDAENGAISTVLEAGSFGSVRAAVSGNLKTAGGIYRLSADYMGTDGTNISRYGNEDDGYDNLTLALSGEHQFNDDVALTFSLRNVDSTTDFDGVDFFVTGLPEDQPYQTESEQRYAGFQLKHQVGKHWRQHLSLGLNQTHNINNNGAPTPEVSRGERRQWQYQLDFIADRHIVSTLLEHQKEEFQQRAMASFYGDPNKDLDSSSHSLAIEYRYDGEDINVSLSGRQDNNSDYDNALSWRATAAWQPHETGMTLYTSIGESIKNPTFTERFGYFDTFIGNPALQPEEALTWELGVRQTLFSDQLQVEMSWFHSNLNNEINGFVFDSVSGGFSAANVSGQSDREGVEFVLAYSPVDRLTMNMNYTYLDATDGLIPNSVSTEVRRPVHSGSINMHYHWERADLSLSVSHTGEQQDDYFPPVPPYQERVLLKGFTLVSLAGGYQLTPKMRLTARVQNLADQEYEEVFGYQSPGMSIHAGFRMSF